MFDGICDYDTDSPGLEDCSWADSLRQAVLDGDAPAAARAAEELEDMLFDEVHRRTMVGWQLKPLRAYAAANADLRTPSGKAVLDALAAASPCVGHERYALDSQKYWFLDLGVLAVRWLRERREEVEALYNRKNTKFNLVRRLFE